MPTIPLINQGTLNKLRASVLVAGNSSLNIGAGYLGKNMLSLSIDTQTVTQIPTQVGVIQSPEPYAEASVTAHLLRTQGLAAAYKQTIESNSVIGNIIVRPDSSALPDFHLINCAIMSIRELAMDGNDGGFVIVIKGYYNVNSSLWDL